MMSIYVGRVPLEEEVMQYSAKESAYLFKKLSLINIPS